MSSQLSPTPWECENVSQCSERSGYAVVKDARGKVLFDTLNSDVAEIRVEHDENGATYYDDQGKADLTLAAAAPDLLAACIDAVAAFEIEVPNGNPTIAALRAAIAKAKGQPSP